jgi:ribosomal protein S18 acetylase RimI-like enzyme
VSIDIVYMRKDLARAWRAACEAVAAEKIYLGRVTLPPFDPDNSFAHRLIDRDWPMYCALDGSTFAGWADIVPSDIPECSHRGTLGMGVAALHRGKGLGARLLQACLDHAPRSGLEKIELTVYTSNVNAIALYRKFGFVEYGLQKDYRRVDGVVYDALLMEKTLS